MLRFWQQVTQNLDLEARDYASSTILIAAGYGNLILVWHYNPRTNQSQPASQPILPAIVDESCL
jgi:hypothetical protein